MLHILWLILKFILILLGILLGLILLAILLILFCPVRYRISASKETASIRSASAKVRVSWLFGMISFNLRYPQEGLPYDIHLFGISLSKLLQKKRSRKKPSTNRTSATESVLETKPLPGPPNKISTVSETKETDSEFETEIADSEINDSSDNPDSSAEEENLQYIKSRICNFCYKIGSICRSLWIKLNRLLEKIRGIPSSIENFTLTIQNICARIETYKNFLDHPRTKAAFTLIKSRMIRLLKHIFPTKIKGTITFGSTDPSVTGTVLAVLGMTIPFHKNCIKITPLFENRNILQGNVLINGRVYGFVLLKTALELYFNKNIKYVIRRWKHKED